MRKTAMPSPQKGLSEDPCPHDGLSSSALCVMLNRMVEEGFAAREGDPDDRRGVSYELTASPMRKGGSNRETETAFVSVQSGRMV
jgi:hypothetical protein